MRILAKSLLTAAILFAGPALAASPASYAVNTARYDLRADFKLDGDNDNAFFREGWTGTIDAVVCNTSDVDGEVATTTLSFTLHADSCVMLNAMTGNPTDPTHGSRLQFNHRSDHRPWWGYVLVRQH